MGQVGRVVYPRCLGPYELAGVNHPSLLSYPIWNQKWFSPSKIHLFVTVTSPPANASFNDRTFN